MGAYLFFFLLRSLKGYNYGIRETQDMGATPCKGAACRRSGKKEGRKVKAPG